MYLLSYAFNSEATVKTISIQDDHTTKPESGTTKPDA